MTYLTIINEKKPVWYPDSLDVTADFLNDWQKIYDHIKLDGTEKIHFVPDSLYALFYKLGHTHTSI